MKRFHGLMMVLALLAGAAPVPAQEEIASVTAGELNDPAPDGLRPGGTLADTRPAPEIAGEPRGSERKVRGWPEQPPVIPHSIRGYQLDKRYNQCLSCHSRNAAPQVGAPMVSVTHFMDREGQVRAAVTPGRYFCTQCHVPQTDTEALVENEFKSADEVIMGEGGQAQ
ncbi:MAG: nitrate reductase cytochrome c-type subunit [Marinobacter sp.]|uniref:nitrate reductase cytochrome c-type subunit n=1 Tax=Marinobacter sp. TaxID=50741 RepID=UPI00299E3469|nr:nitrate reductase cytochrome c-type subunit [Marinobacter sp.]MDX1633972.1 nitrate reductase cytochrome c-type subunit [Marinobacter sp.]